MIKFNPNFLNKPSSRNNSVFFQSTQLFREEPIAVAVSVFGFLDLPSPLIKRQIWGGVFLHLGRLLGLATFLPDKLRDIGKE